MILFLFYTGLTLIGYHILKKFLSPKDFNTNNTPSIPPWKFIWAYLKDKPIDEIQEIVSNASREGILKLNAGTISFYYFQDVDYVKQMLTTSEDILPKMEQNLGYRFNSFYGKGVLFANGDRWRRYRKLANAAFNRALSHDVVGENAFKLFKLMDSGLNEPINIYSVMKRVTLEILSQVAFNYKLGGLDSFQTPDIIKSYQYILNQSENPFYLLFPMLSLLPLESNRKFLEKMNEFDDFVLNIVKQRREKLFKLSYQDEKKDDTDETSYDDLLSTMLKLSEKEGIKIDSRELRDNLVNILSAGHDTTSFNMTTSIYHLAKYPGMQKKAREEVIRVFGNELKVPTPEQVKELKYVNAIIKESLRMYPPLVILSPRQPQDYVQIGPHVIPPNSYICANTWHIHHDPKHWKNPHQYDPERFLSDEKRHTFSFIPFSGGPRNCAGQNFSLMEQRILISMMLLKYEWTLPEGSIHEEKLRLTGNFLLKPKDLSVEIQFKQRKSG